MSPQKLRLRLCRAAIVQSFVSKGLSGHLLHVMLFMLAPGDSQSLIRRLSTIYGVLRFVPDSGLTGSLHQDQVSRSAVDGGAVITSAS
jgi:hypothetical protein